MAKKKNYDKDLQYLLDISLTILIILLSILNLQKDSSNKVNVLGTSIETDTIKLENEKAFWEKFQAKNPTYIDGWIELGRLDKVKQIDPNYLLQP